MAYDYSDILKRFNQQNSYRPTRKPFIPWANKNVVPDLGAGRAARVTMPEVHILSRAGKKSLLNTLSADLTKALTPQKPGLFAGIGKALHGGAGFKNALAPIGKLGLGALTVLPVLAMMNSAAKKQPSLQEQQMAAGDPRMMELLQRAHTPAVPTGALLAGGLATMPMMNAMARKTGLAGQGRGLIGGLAGGLKGAAGIAGLGLIGSMAGNTINQMHYQRAMEGKRREINSYNPYALN